MESMSTSFEHPVYLAVKPDPVLAVLHPASHGGALSGMPARDEGALTGILICPPFGWEDVCSYRARREWAQALAGAGHSVVRIEFPGAGDSAGSPRDPKRLEAWTAALTHAAGWLRSVTGCSRVAALGIGLGGMVACRAVARNALIDDLMLWGVPSRGHTLLRQLTAFGRFAAAQFPDPNGAAPPPLPEGFLEVSGFLLSGETVGALEKLDLVKLAVPRGAERRILLLARDGLPIEARLQAHFERSGAELCCERGEGYAELMINPQQAITPHALFARTISWLGDAPSPSHGSKWCAPQRAPLAGLEDGTRRATPSLARKSIEIESDGGRIREQVISLELGPGRLVGVLAEPVGSRVEPLCAVFLNAGAVRRIGPNRAWVQASRRWAARGVPSVRIDLEGLGDSDGEDRGYVDNASFYTEHLVDQTLAVLGALQQRGLPGRFILTGLCSGAYWAYHAAVRDERVLAALMIDLYAFEWDGSLVARREARRTLALARSGGIGWLRSGAVTPERVWRVTRSSVGSLRGRGGERRGAAGGTTYDPDPVPALDRLRDAGAQALLLLSRGAPLYDDFVRTGCIDQLRRWPNLVLESIPSRDHTFRAIWLQQQVHASLDRALRRALGSVGAPRAGLRGRRDLTVPVDVLAPGDVLAPDGTARLHVQR